MTMIAHTSSPILIATLVTLLQFFCQKSHSADQPVPLATAIAEFNRRAQSDRIGKNQPPLDDEEVLCAIRYYQRPSDAPVSDAMLASFKQIAETKSLPPSAAFEKLTGYDPGGDFIYDVWSIRIRIEREDGSSYAFPIRQRMVASRTLEEELERLTTFIEAQSADEWVGGYRYRVREMALKDRISARAADKSGAR